MVISAAQCRAARAILGWKLDKLAEESGVSKKTINQFENGEVSPFDRTINDIANALENGGAVFIEAVAEKYEAGASRRWGMLDPKLVKKPSGQQKPDENHKNVNQALIDHWVARPELWASMVDASKRALMREMGVSSEEDIFGKGAAE